MRNRELDRHRASKALQLLIRDIAKIRYVSDWADAACVSPEWLRKKMNLIYGKAPSIIVREVRYEVILSLIVKQGVNLTSVEVAIDSGVGQTSDSLYKFLKRYYGVTFTELKEKILMKRQVQRELHLNEYQKYTVYTEYGDIYTEIDDSMYLSNKYKSSLLRTSRQIIQ